MIVMIKYDVFFRGANKMFLQKTLDKYFYSIKNNYTEIVLFFEARVEFIVYI